MDNYKVLTLIAYRSAKKYKKVFIFENKEWKKYVNNYNYISYIFYLDIIANTVYGFKFIIFSKNPCNFLNIYLINHM